MRLPPVAPGGRRGLVDRGRAGLRRRGDAARVLCGPVMLAMTVGHTLVVMVCARSPAWWETWHPRAWRDRVPAGARRRPPSVLSVLPWSRHVTSAGCRSPRWTSWSRTARVDVAEPAVRAGRVGRRNELTLPATSTTASWTGRRAAGSPSSTSTPRPACPASSGRVRAGQVEAALRDVRRVTATRHRRRPSPINAFGTVVPDDADVRGRRTRWAGRSTGRSAASSSWSCRGRGSGPTPSTSGRPAACSSSRSPGKNGPPVYTALSRDIVAHECGHALLDAVVPSLYDSSRRSRSPSTRPSPTWSP